MRTIKEEEVDLSEYRDYHDVYQHIGQFIEDVYMRHPGSLSPRLSHPG